MHGKIKGLEFIYDEHRYHHGAYSPGRFVNSSSKHKYLGLVLCVEHIFITLIPLIVVLSLSRPIYVVVVIAFGILHQLVYNKLHVGMHLGRKLNFLPRWFKDLCVSNHYWHHEEPGTHYCVAAPGADWIVGTISKSFSFIEHADDYEVKPKDDLEIEKLNVCKLTTYKDSLPGVYKPWNSPELANKLCKVITWLFIGKVNINYRLSSFLDWDKSPMVVGKGGYCIYALNHGSWRDVFILSLINPNIRLMTHIGVMKSCFGLVGMLLGRVFGFFPVAPRDSSALDVATQMVQKGEPVAIFPEGWAWIDGKVREFRTGAVRVSNSTKKQTPIIPVYIKYNYYPRKWILKFPPPIQYLISILLPKSRSGATVYIGSPFLPQGDVRESTNALREKIINLCPKEMKKN